MARIIKIQLVPDIVIENSVPKLLVRALPGVALIPLNSLVAWEVDSLASSFSIPAFPQATHPYPFVRPSLRRHLRWEMYFLGQSPFFRRAGFKTYFETKVQSPHPTQGRHTGESEELPATQDGDFKYGVKVIDQASGDVISDDDPRLIVSRRI